MPCRYALICSTGSPGPKIVTLGPKSGGAGVDAAAGATPEMARAPVTPAAATARSRVRRLVVRGMVVLQEVRVRGGRSVRGERRLGRLHGPCHPDADRRGQRDNTQHEDRRAQAERTAEGEPHERADELADEERRRPDPGAASPL